MVLADWLTSPSVGATVLAAFLALVSVVYAARRALAWARMSSLAST